MSLPEIRPGEPWVWPDGTPVRVAGPCAATKAREMHGRHDWSPTDPEQGIRPTECLGYPVPPTWAEQEAQRAWDRHAESALAVVR